MSSQTGSADRLQVGDLTIWPGRRQVFRGDHELAVTGRSFDFLMALVQAAPDIATPDQLSERAWGGRPVSPETINQRAKLLREALGDDSSQPRYFTAVRGQGYRLLAAVGTPPTRSLQRTALRRLLGVLGGMFILVALLLALNRVGPSEHGQAAAETHYHQARLLMQRHSATGLNQAAESFGAALGFAPDHVASLAGLAEVRLLQARYRLLDRSVVERMAGDLVDRALAMEPESAAAWVAQGLLNVLQNNPEAAEAAYRTALRLDPGSASAHLHYGFLLLEEPGLHRPFEAVELWRQGARLNPDSTLLRVHLAWTDMRAGRGDQARDELRAVLALEPELAPAHFVLAELYLSAGRPVEAIASYRKTLELNRYLTPLAHEGMLRALIDLGQDQAVTEVLAGIRAMPDNAGWAASLSLVADLEAAQPGAEQVRRIRVLAEEAGKWRPSDGALALAMLAMQEQDPLAARELLAQAEVRLDGPLGELPVDGYWRNLICPYAHLLIESGESERGRATANWLLNRIDGGPDLARFPHLDRVLCLTAIGQADQALALLNRAASAGLPTGWRFIAWRPDLAALHAHPEFPALRGRLEVKAQKESDRLVALGLDPIFP
ncbi:MAG: winged helix-turn-helix domain-containing protein [Wenzhouxiangella sp.]|nr:winged helix-turn-helix domain-containing protein [Wenzhouxiangella sp.]